MSYRKFNSTVENVTPASQQGALYGDVLHRLETAAKIPVTHSLIIFVFVFVLLSVVGVQTRWWKWFFGPFITGWISAFAYYIYALWRWHVMVERVKTGDFDGDGKKDVGKRTLVFRIDKDNGEHSVVHTDIPEDWKTDILTVARAFNAGRPTSQTVMNKNHRIGRKKLQKIMDAFLELEIIHLDEVSNSYELNDDEASKKIMADIAYANFEELTDVWKK